MLHSQPTAVYQEHSVKLVAVAADTHKRYAEIMRDVENLINDHSKWPIFLLATCLEMSLTVRLVAHQRAGAEGKSKLKLLVPTVGTFFTPLLLEDAFNYQDKRRYISRRRFVSPSFNDIRLTLNTAQLMGLIRGSTIDLVTFDGDVTLYEDGASITDDNPVVPRIVRLLRQGKKVGIVTAAGYTEPSKYYGRLKGLLDAVHRDLVMTEAQKNGLIVLGGESNFLFKFDRSSPDLLTYVPQSEWVLDEMRSWHEEDIEELLDIAEASLRQCVSNLHLPAAVLRKERAVGVYPLAGHKMHREQLEETVLVVQSTLDRTDVGSRLPFCAFNGQ